MKKSIQFFIFVMSAFVGSAMADIYNASSAPCGYAAIIMTSTGPGTQNSDLVSATSSRYQGKCLSEEQVGKALLKYCASDENHLKWWCGFPAWNNEYWVRKGVTIFDTENSGAQLAENFIRNLKQDPFWQIYGTVRSLDKNLLNYLDLVDNPKIIRASTKDSGSSTSGNVSQIKIGDAVYSCETKDGMCEGYGTLSTSNAIIKGQWKNNMPTGDMQVSYRNGGIYIGEYSVRPDSQRPGSFISSRTGSGVLISSDGTKNRGLWFDDLYVGQRTPQDEPIRMLTWLQVSSKILPNNMATGTSCDPSHFLYSTCKYSSDDDHAIQNFGANIVANHQDINLKFVLPPGSTPLFFLVGSGRFSIYSKFSESDEALKLLKIAFGRYELYDGKSNSCGGDGCQDIDKFEIVLAQAAATQCSKILIDYLEMKGINLTSDAVNGAFWARSRAKEFPIDSPEYATCMQLAQRLTK